MSLVRLEERLDAAVRSLGTAAVGFSGGVDSALLAAALQRYRPANAAPPIAVTATSATTSDDERSNARRVASEIGIRLIELETGEMRDTDFLANGPDRCYHCKRIRFAAILEKLRAIEESEGIAYTLCDGSNADDAHDYRPGRRALLEFGIRSPLAEIGMTKTEIRVLAEKWRLSCAARPSNPCLATRIPYHTPPTEESLRRIEAAEKFLVGVGFPVCRVRLDEPLVARIEIERSEIPRLAAAPLAERLAERFAALGFVRFSIDSEGFVSGKMNRLGGVGED